MQRQRKAPAFCLGIIILAGLPLPVVSEVVNAINEVDQHVVVAAVCTGEGGETSFFDHEIRWFGWFGSNRRTLSKQAVTSLGFYHWRAGLDMGLHYAPRKQFLLILSGTLEIEASNGDVRTFPPGSVALVTDDESDSRGHKTRVIGTADVFAAVAPLNRNADGSTLNCEE